MVVHVTTPTTQLNVCTTNQDSTAAVPESSRCLTVQEDTMRRRTFLNTSAALGGISGIGLLAACSKEPTSHDQART